MGKENPLVSVNILSFNRKDELRNTLLKVYSQNYKNIEVIVVDNNSTDGAAEMVESEFPFVKIIKLKENTGIAGWNEGFKIAKGEYVLVLDDDSYPEENTIEEGIGCMLEFIDCGVLGFSIYNMKQNNYETKHINKLNPITFVGCGALFKNEVLKVTGGFLTLLFLYEHEIEFSMRAQNMGYKIYYYDKSKIIHNSNVINRNFNSKKTVDYRRQYYVIRNILYVIFIHFTLRKTVLRIVRIILGRLFFAMLNGYFLVACRSIFSFLISIPKLIFYRDILSKTVQEIYDYGSYAGGVFFDNIKKRKFKNFFG